MQKLSLSLLFMTLLFCTSCSQNPDVQGKWKNANGETLNFSTDSSVVLGQEGSEGGLEGRFTIDGDTVRITTAPAMDDLGEFHNEFVLVARDEKLQMVAVTLHRAGDFDTISISELAKKLRKSEDEYAFKRMEK